MDVYLLVSCRSRNSDDRQAQGNCTALSHEKAILRGGKTQKQDKSIGSAWMDEWAFGDFSGHDSRHCLAKSGGSQMGQPENAQFFMCLACHLAMFGQAGE